MLWPPLVLLAFAVAAAILGVRIMNGPGPGDQRAGGAVFVAVAAFFAALAVAWWIGAVTWRVFS